MSEHGEELKVNLKAAAISAASVLVIVLVTGALRVLLTHGFHANWQPYIRVTLPLAFILGAAWFVVTFALSYLSSSALKPAISILSEEQEEAALLPRPLPGFVAMEYYGLIFNRTYLIAVAPEGLYAWKVAGWLASMDPTFFTPYQQLVSDPGLMRNMTALRKLSALRGGFFLPRSHILAVVANRKRKWGMGQISQSGRVSLKLTDGKEREFILVGFQDLEAVQQTVFSGALPAGPTHSLEPAELPYVIRQPKKLWIPLITCFTALSVILLHHLREQWHDANWRLRMVYLTFIALPAVLAMDAFRKITLTETGIERRTRLGKRHFIPYAEIEGAYYASDGNLLVKVLNGKAMKIVRSEGDFNKIVRILTAKVPSRPPSD